MRDILIEDVMSVTGCTSTDLKNWARRSFLKNLEDTSQGRARRFSRPDVYSIAFMVSLAKAGVSLFVADTWVENLMPKIGTKEQPAYWVWCSDDDQPSVFEHGEHTLDGVFTTLGSWGVGWEGDPDSETPHLSPQSLCMLNVQATIEMVDRKLDELLSS